MITGGKKAVAVIGEGITEKYYIESLRGLVGRNFQILPQQLGLKASSLVELEKAIMKAVDEGHDEVYCLIDMDSKEAGAGVQKYEKLKMKYHDRHFVKKRKGVDCYVRFIETRRCTELWFIYYFEYLTRHFSSYKEVENRLHKFVPDYEKTERYFRGAGNLHKRLLACGGNLKRALGNAEKSVAACKQMQSTDASYSEMFVLFQALDIVE